MEGFSNKEFKYTSILLSSSKSISSANSIRKNPIAFIQVERISLKASNIEKITCTVIASDCWDICGYE